jgi:hypothetical protein
MPNGSSHERDSERANRVLVTPGVQQAFAQLHGRAWGVAMGLCGGLALLLATWALVLRGGEHVGAHLRLLAMFFPGYSVTIGGGLIGFVYMFVLGYGLGRLIGTVYTRLLPEMPGSRPGESRAS